ncbi:DUF350 domain-containing protein [uncultured Ferrimonas sp.]|uniref:DUF350 domain-containing protein n=1 Tax=uncultured Ferrimonas sp. TaxID=432640 RepID=UPI002606592F|nr:DUF350 domain-containing protein [uncultured Ferrimonas sp.]
MDIVAGLSAFLGYFASGVVAIALFKLIYAFITPFDEWALIKAGNNAAALSLGGALLGYTIALASAVSHSVTYVDFATWAAVALLAQLLAFAVVRFALLTDIVAKIEDNHLASAIVLASINISIGVLNAACMSY